jgi:Holliday junction resolvase RusA-like endonuclease
MIPKSQLQIGKGVTFTVPAGGACFEVDLGWPISFNAYKSKGPYPCKEGRIWRDTVRDEIWKPLGGKPPEPCIGKVAVWWEIWPPDDKRKRDIDNFTGKHCLDALEHAKIFRDDSQVAMEVKIKRPKWRTGRVIVTVHEM